MKRETLETNKRQSEFYNSKRKNVATTLWYKLRNGLLQNVRREFRIDHQIHQLHLSWLGDLSQKKVLDLGCYAGNSLSIYLAQNSREYVAIDLSERGISRLRKRIENIPSAKAITIDFLAEEFTEDNFDLIYAYGVLHHFKDVTTLINRLNEKLKSNGRIISYDPLQTSLPIKVIRTIYRPFQSDREWEWPISKEVFYKFNNSFNIIDKRGMLGKAKWFFVVNILPFSSSLKKEIGKKWQREDWEKSQYSDAYLFSCMHFTMLMQKRNKCD